MDHVNAISRFHPETIGEPKNLVRRATGNFYTPPWMARRLVTKLLRNTRLGGDVMRAVDPFCGDGRLLVALVELIGVTKRLREVQWHFELWDNNREVLTGARTALVN